MSPSACRLVGFDEAAAEVRDGDLLLWRRPGLSAIAGRGEYCHAGMAGRWGDELMSLESRLAGVQAAALRSRVGQWPGQIDVFEADAAGRWPEFSRTGALRAMRRKTGRQYGLWNLLRTAATHMAFVRLLVRVDTRDNGLDPDSRQSEFCSEAVASATRLGGGVDPVPELRDRFTEPDDLARSAFYRYRFTLVP